MLIIAVVLQLTGPVAVLMFSYGWRYATLTVMHTDYEVLNFYSLLIMFQKMIDNEDQKIFHRDPAMWTIDSVNQVCKWLH